MTVVSACCNRSKLASIFRLGQSFRVTWTEAFVSVDRQGLGESRKGTRQGGLLEVSLPVSTGKLVTVANVGSVISRCSGRT